ncbi:major facilitator superfamily domain-containing protein [Schizophyllum amplum]|uniref:Major facilitator superfamily domain-containing protein n=1 Tax=Schizophyllum amplum TaxID=97359 RepID=A0A550CKH4_9AGAR|nr:major facilitator superfamily domain-containing protein [Auriculariopsis ampla]
MSSAGSASELKQRRPWTSYVWDTWDKPPEERRFLFKLDCCLLTYAALSYFSKYLDQQNITNAYVSGMKEDLGLTGNDLNYITTAWTCGYVIGQIPSNLLITRIRPSIWIPAMELIWSVLTMVLATTTNFSSVVAIRFFVGLAESTFYPAISYVIGSWYKGEELAKRACIFHTASAIGPMFSGFLQTGAYNGLNGVRGLPGWKWLFVIDGIITIPIALLGFVIMPDHPSNTKPSFLYTEEQLRIANERVEKIGRKPPAHYTKAKVLGFFTTWHLYTLVPLYILFNNGSYPAQSMIFWFKSFTVEEHGRAFTIGQINTYPLGQNVLQAITTLVWAWWSDAIQKRWPPILFAGCWNMAVVIALAATPVYSHIARRWALYYMTHITSGLSGIILTWANELTSDDSEKRSFVVACCNTFAYVFQAWLPIVIIPQVEQPRVLKGNITTACIMVGMMAFAMLTLYFSRRDDRRVAAKARALTEDGDSVIVGDHSTDPSRKTSLDKLDGIAVVEATVKPL